MILRRSLFWWITPTGLITILVQCLQFMTSTQALSTISPLASLEQCARHLLKLAIMTGGLRWTVDIITFAWRQPKSCSTSHKEMAPLHWFTRGQPLCGESVLTSGLESSCEGTRKQINHMRWQKYSRSNCLIIISQGLKKNLNSSLPFWTTEAALKFCLPWASLCLLFYSVGRRLAWVLAHWASKTDKLIARQENLRIRDDRTAFFLVLFCPPTCLSFCLYLHQACSQDSKSGHPKCAKSSFWKIKQFSLKVAVHRMPGWPSG